MCIYETAQCSSDATLLKLRVLPSLNTTGTTLLSALGQLSARLEKYRYNTACSLLETIQVQSSRKSVGPPDMSGKIVSGPVTIPRNPDRMSGVIFAPKI